MLYRFIDSQKAEFGAKLACRVCGVSRTAYYDWAAGKGAGADEATIEEAHLANRIYDIWAGSRGRYGAPRITAQLWRERVKINHKRVERLMGTLGIQGICGRRKVITTRRDPRAIPAPDLVQRGFGAAEIDRLYVGDITYSAQPVVMCSRMGVGLAFAW
jgi:hypothetical protein